MLYRVQGRVLDILARFRLPDQDGFGTELAQLYLARRASLDFDEFVAASMRLRTSTFASRRRERRTITAHIVATLDKSYLPMTVEGHIDLPISTKQTGRIRRLQAAARKPTGAVAFGELIDEFSQAIEQSGVDGFWESRTKGKLRSRPEQIAQQSLTMFLYIPIKVKAGFVLNEIKSGVGYIDVLAVFGKSQRYVTELKIITGKRLTGVGQLATYLETQGLNEGWLTVFDARPKAHRTELPTKSFQRDGKTIHPTVIDINPIAPSRIVDD